MSKKKGWSRMRKGLREARRGNPVAANMNKFNKPKTVDHPKMAHMVPKFDKRKALEEE